MSLGPDFWARFLVGIMRRDTSLGESRLDKESRRWSDGCMLVLLILLIVLAAALWKPDLFFGE